MSLRSVGGRGRSVAESSAILSEDTAWLEADPLGGVQSAAAPRRNGFVI